ncbi:MAG: hypothetical protein WAQ98_28835 [Blastocatellia bacterium]
MSINSINTSINLRNIDSINQNQQSINTNSETLQTPTNTGELVRREDTSLLGASLLRMQLQQSATSLVSSNSNTQPPPSPSLKPREVFNPQVNTFLKNTISLPTNKFRDNRTVATVNSANVLQSSQISFKGGGSATSFYTAGFPPTSVATLPRMAFDKAGTLSFYKSAQPLSDTQLQSVQNLYAGDLTSRKNYSVNLANLASNLTTLRNSGNLDNKLTGKIDTAINNLKTAYNALSDVNAPAPSPRQIYAQVANAYRALDSSCDLNQNQKNLVKTGVNILAIGASNYDTNRVPVAGTPITPAPAMRPTPDQAAAAGFPLPNFNTVRNNPLSQAQANPAQVFGADVTKYLKTIGLNNIDTNKINYQVNSADKLQFINVPLGDGRSQTVFFNGGFPVPAGTAPQATFSGTTGVRQYLDVAKNSQQTQQRLTAFYADPANAARRNNYNVNLQNLTSAFQQLNQLGNLKDDAKNVVQNSISKLQNAQQQIANGGLPDVLGLYQQLGDNLDKLSQQQGFNQRQRGVLDTLNGSLLPIGVQNYYFTPIGLSQQA